MARYRRTRRRPGARHDLDAIKSMITREFSPTGAQFETVRQALQSAYEPFDLESLNRRISALEEQVYSAR